MISVQASGSNAPRRIGSKLVIPAIALIMSAAAVLPFYSMGHGGEIGRFPRMPVTHDMGLHLDQMKSFYDGLAAGAVYPRWEEGANRGFGAPTPSYYPPGIYYLTSVFYVATRDWMWTLLIVHLVMMTASAAAIYRYARSRFSATAAAVCMAAYIVLPYHLIDQYQRGAMAELLGFTWMPLIMLFADRLIEERAAWLMSILGLGASYGAFFWSHPPTAYQFSLVLVPAALFLTVASRNWRGLLRFGLGIGLGLCLAAAYLYPAFREQELIRHEYIREHWPYHESYVFARTEYSEVHRAFFDRIDDMWVFSIAAVVICGLALIPFKLPAAGSRFRVRVLAWIGMGLIASFLMSSLSEPIARYLPEVEIGVFPWRMLAITTLVVALLAGACAHAARRRWLERRFTFSVISGLAAAAIIAGGAAFSIRRVASPMVYAPAFEPYDEHLNFAMLPHTGPQSPQGLPHLPRAALGAGDGLVEVEYWKPEQRGIVVNLAEPDELSIRTFNFPGWTALVDGRLAEIMTGRLGNIVIGLPPGSHRVTLEYRDTPARKVGETVTLLAMLILVTAVVHSEISRRKRK